MRIRNQGGFTLIEILVSIALLTVITLILSGTLAPWLTFKSKLDTDRKITELQSALSQSYTNNAMTVEVNQGAAIQTSEGVMTPSTVSGAGQCTNTDASWQALGQFLSEGYQLARKDGYGNEFCIFITQQLATNYMGASIYYHNVAIVSTGRAHKLAAGTSLDANGGALSLGTDNVGILVSGYSIQSAKAQQVFQQMQRIESLYESYFTTRYLATASRDISIDYFATANAGGGSAWDSGGNAIVTNTSGNTQSNAYDYLHPLGVSLQDATTPYESDNQIKIGNYNECWGTTCVRSSANVGAPPFTAVLFAQLPGPSGEGLTQTVTGNY